MALEMTLSMAGPRAEITLAGELDANEVPRFQRELHRVFDHWENEPPSAPPRLVLSLRDLVFMASAGVRMFIVTTQQLKPKLKLKAGEVLTIYVVAPQEGPLETLRRAGVLHSVVVVDEFPAPGD